MNRRELMKHAGVGLAGLGTGYAVIQSGTQNASASVSADGLQIADASHTDTDGTIKTVTVDVSGEWSYDLPSGRNPHRWQVELLVTNGDRTVTLDQAHGNAKYLGFSGEYKLGGDLTDTELYEASHFSAPDGKIKTVTIGFVVRLKVANPNGDVLARSVLEDTADVKVTHPAYKPEEHGSASGSGGLTIIDD
jgi:hypothetical protein